MKKNLLFLLVAFIGMSALNNSNAQSIYFEDNFDSYEAGEFLCVQNNSDWTTWSNDPGSGEDAEISDAQSSSNPNSLNIKDDNDIIYRFANQTTGHYLIEMDYLIPAGSNGGYFNVQHYFKPGQQWAFECYFNGTGSGRLTAGKTNTNFTVPVNEWFHIEIDVNLDDDECTLTVEGSIVRKWPFRYQADNANGGVNQLGSVNFYASYLGSGGGGGNYFVDNFVVTEISEAYPGVFVIDPEQDIEVDIHTTGSEVIKLSNPGGSDIDYQVVAVYDIPNPNSTSTGQQQVTYVSGDVESGIWWNGASQITVASGYAPAKINNHIGKTIRSFKFGLDKVQYVTAAKLCIWDMGPFGMPSLEAPVYVQNIATSTLKDGSDNSVTLTTPWLIDGRYIYIGLELTVVPATVAENAVLVLVDPTPVAQTNSLGRLIKSTVAWTTLNADLNGHWDMTMVVDGTPIKPWMSLNHTSATLQPAANKDLSINFGATDITTNCTKEGKLYFFSTDFYKELTVLNVVANFKMEPVIITTSLPAGELGLNYNKNIEYNGANVSFTKETGNLPTGLTLSTQGLVSGIPTEVGSFTFAVKATNAAGSDSKEYTIVIKGEEFPEIITKNLPDGELGVAYEATLEANTEVTWTLGEGSALPDGLTLSEEGVISGTPTKVGTFEFSIVATNSIGSASEEFSIDIAKSGISGKSIQSLNVFVQNSILYVNGLVPGEKWTISSISGVVVYEGIATNSIATQRITKGIFIVKSGNRTAKVVF